LYFAFISLKKQDRFAKDYNLQVLFTFVYSTNINQLCVQFFKKHIFAVYVVLDSKA